MLLASERATNKYDDIGEEVICDVDQSWRQHCWEPVITILEDVGRWERIGVSDQKYSMLNAQCSITVPARDVKCRLS